MNMKKPVWTPTDDGYRVEYQPFDFANATADELLDVADRFEKVGDYRQAAVCLQKSADMGDVLAKYYLAEAYRKGQGVAEDCVKAAALYAEVVACEEQLIFAGPDEPLTPQCEAAYQLGRFHEDGVISDASMEQALEYYRWSAVNGYAGGQYRLVELYLEGERVPRDVVKAAGLLYAAFYHDYPHAEIDGLRTEYWMIQKAEQILADKTVPYEDGRATAYDVLLEALGRLTTRYERDSEREKEAFRAKELGVTVEELRRQDEEAKTNRENGIDARFMSTDGFLF